VRLSPAWTALAIVVAGLVVAGAAPTLGATVAVAPGSSSGAFPAYAAGPSVSVPVGISGNNSSANATGPGIFYTSEALPSAPLGQEACAFGSCFNISNDVSTTVTPHGLLVAAYTTLSDHSPCSSMRGSSVSNIALVTSSNSGATWSHAQYLGNPVCSQTGYPDAWEPSVASLANGTLVLAYVEYGLPFGSMPPLSQYSWPPTESRLVVTESYDNGAEWTLPTVLNISNPASAPPGLQFTPALPSIATIGQTIYLTWMSLTTENSAGSIALEVSTNGGAVWSPTVAVASGFEAGYSMDPQATIGPGGELVIAYTANVSQSSSFCGANGCVTYPNPVWEGSVWVAASGSNGTEFHYSMVAPNVPLGSPGWAPEQNPVSYGPFETPAPQIAYAPANRELYVAFTAGQIANGSTYCFYGQDGCLVDGLYFFNSSDGGTNWTYGNINDTVVNATAIDPSTFNLNATDSVTSVSIATVGEEVDLEAGYYDGTLCAFGTECGVQTEVVFSTTTEGRTFTAPATIAARYTPFADAWSGEYTSIAEMHVGPRFFWSLNSCPGYAASPCSGYPYSNLAVSQVEVSSYYNGSATATMSFVAHGVTGPANWTMSILGNLRAGPASRALSVSGIPTGYPIFFNVAGINTSTDAFYVFASGVSPQSPVTLHANVTVNVDFVRYVPVTVAYNVPDPSGEICQSTLGLFSGCPSFSPACLNEAFGGYYQQSCFSYFINPAPPAGVQWIPAGTSESYSIAPFPNPYCYYPNGGLFGDAFCDYYQFKLDPLGWAGAGPGSASTPGLNVTFTPQGPVTETASFLYTGLCIYYYDFYLGALQFSEFYGCQNVTAPLSIQENGLPNGDTWGVTLSGAAGNGTVSSFAGVPIINETADVGPAGISAWNVPSSSPGMVYVASISQASPMLLPVAGTIWVNYTLEPAADLSVPVQVQELGLPAGLAGNATLTDTADGVETSVSSGVLGGAVTLPGGTYTVNATPVVTTSGVSYYPAEIYASVGLAGEVNQSGVSPSTVNLEGPATITLAYGTEYWVGVTAGPGGTVSTPSQWVPAGGSLSLDATPDHGYSFLYWAGTGSGAAAGASADLAQVAILPGGPVTEFAVFGLTPPTAWTVTVVASGLPLDQEYSVTLGGTTFTGNGSFQIGNVSTGTYAVSVPTVSAAGTSLVRYLETGISATRGLAGDQLTVTADLILEPTFATQYLVAVSFTGSGNINMASGPAWYDDNTTLSITATPGPGQQFLGWWSSVGDNPSVLTSSSTELAIVIASSLNLVAEFGPAPPIAAATYALAVGETGLPSGTAWAFTLSPGAGASGTTSTLTSTGLNGTYTIDVPIVYASIGVRYVPATGSSQVLAVTADRNASVTFTAQVLVMVSASGGGTDSAGSWVGVGQSYALSAAPAPTGLVFLGWQGSGPGNYTGPNASANVVPSGPVTETATYGPAPAAASTSPSTPWTDYLAIGLVAVALLGVGVWQGLASARRRSPPPAQPPTTPSPSRASSGDVGAPASSSERSSLPSRWDES
jgi:Divergent InlB B-repeat domain